MTREEFDKLIMGWGLEDGHEEENVIIIQQRKDEKKRGVEIRELVLGAIDYIANGVEVSFPHSVQAQFEFIPFDLIVAIYPVRNQKEAAQLAMELLSHLIGCGINLSLLQKIFTPREETD